jgi:hypothetical protein
MRITFSDGKRASLNFLSKTREYRSGDTTDPQLAHNLITRHAAMLVPPGWPPGKRPVYAGPNEILQTSVSKPKLPPVLVVAEFVCHPATEPRSSPQFLRLCWVQSCISEDVEPDVLRRLESQSWADLYAIAEDQ